MSKTGIIILIVIILIVAGLAFWFIGMPQNAPTAANQQGANGSSSPSTTSSASGMIMPTSTGTTTATGSTATSAAASNASVSIANFSFVPATIAVKAGGTVTWKNNDSVPHTVTTDDGQFTSQTLPPGATYSHTFAAAGTLSYHCSIHPSMHGTVIVQ